MQRLRVLNARASHRRASDRGRARLVFGLALLVATAHVPAGAAWAAEAAAAQEAETEEPQPLRPGDVLDFTDPLPRAWPSPGEVQLLPRRGRALAVFLWGTWSKVSRDDLMALDAFVAEHDLNSKMDVYAVAPFREGKGSPGNVAEMCAILGVSNLTVLADEGLVLANRVGATQFPELIIFDKDGKMIAYRLRGLDHGRLRGPNRRASDVLLAVARDGTAPPVPRVGAFYPGDRLLRRRFRDAELPRFSPVGWGAGERVRLSDLMSGERPAVLFFFSSTCNHCQVDVPQLVQYLKDNPGMFDVIGITRIRDERHRRISEQYFRAQEIPFPIVEDVGTVADMYNVVSTPTTFYLSPSGMIVKTTYFQHQDLAADWSRLHPTLMGAPDPPPTRADRGWHFPLKLRDEQGQEVDLASMEGKPTILHFWATWCEPCRRELPALLRRVPRLQQNGNFLLISVEDEAARLQSFRESTGLSFTSYLAPHGGLAEQIDFSRVVPRTYVLDAHGNLQNIYVGDFKWDENDRFYRILGQLIDR